MKGDYPGWNGQASMGRVVTTAAGSWSKVCDANERRTALLLSPAESDTTYYSCEADNSSLTGFVLRNTAQPLLLSRALHGGMVTRAWFARGVAGSQIIRCVESLGDEE